jgi:hypothetical protein
MLWDIRVSIEAVNDIEEGRVLWSLHWQVGSAASAQNQDVNLILHPRKITAAENRRSGYCLYIFWIPAGEDSRKRLVLICQNRLLNSFSKVSVTKDTDPDAHLHPSFQIQNFLPQNFRRSASVVLSSMMISSVPVKRAKFAMSSFVRAVETTE